MAALSYVKIYIPLTTEDQDGSPDSQIIVDTLNAFCDRFGKVLQYQGEVYLKPGVTLLCDEVVTLEWVTDMSTHRAWIRNAMTALKDSFDDHRNCHGVVMDFADGEVEIL